jgi:hypothetical protein
MVVRGSSTYDGVDAVQCSLNGQFLLILQIIMVHVLQLMHTDMVILMFACVLYLHHE